MLPIHVALVSESRNIDPTDVPPVAAALQKQATRDFGPIWRVHATVDAFSSLDDVPLDYWPIMRRAFSAIRPARIILVERPQQRGWSSDSWSHQHIVGVEERAHASGDGIAESQRLKQIHCRESASVFHAGKCHRL